MVEAANPNTILSKRKSLRVLFPYAAWMEQQGKRDMLDALLRATRVMRGLEQIQTGAFALTLPIEASARAVILMSPHASWWLMENQQDQVSRWAAAASMVPYTEEVGQCVVDTLLHIASIDSLQSRIPTSTWAWLGKRPSLPPGCLGRSRGIHESVIRQVRALGDIEILKSYLLVVWSEWEFIGSRRALSGMVDLIREDLGGIELGHHREDLVERLDYVLGQLDQGLGHLKRYGPNVSKDMIRWAGVDYRELKRMLMVVDGEAMNVLTRMPPTSILFRLLKHASRVSLDIHVRSASPIPMNLYLKILWLLPPTNHCVCTST